MSDRQDTQWASSPCFLSELDPPGSESPSLPASATVCNALGRMFGFSWRQGGRPADNPFLQDLSRLFSKTDMTVASVLETTGEPWSRIYFVQYGIVQLFTQASHGKRAIHEFFAEGAIVWPVFDATRTPENMLALTAATAGQVWTADFEAFQAALAEHGLWERFALPLTRALAEQSLTREFRRENLTDVERYKLMIAEYPLISRRVSEHQLAAWIGMAPSTFSRLKAESTGLHK